jgi:hypothetical protein
VGTDREVRAALGTRLRERLPEIEGAIATRIYAISDPRVVSDQTYLQALNEAVAAATSYRLAVLEASARQATPIPTVLLGQARLDARDGVPLDAVLRRYAAGTSLFATFLAEEAERVGVPSSLLRSMLAAQAALGDRLLAAVSEEYAREGNRPRSELERLREVVKGLTAGELVDTSEIPYGFDACHLGLMTKGERGEEAVRALARGLGCRLLIVRREEEPTWAAWLGGRSRLQAERAASALADLPPGVCVSIGEPGEGVAGWRFSHFQAKAALSLADPGTSPVVRYADVALLAAVLRDNLIEGSLRQLYLAPLKATRDGGEAARATLRAYFAAERNVSATAAALGVDRRTVRNRLRGVEHALGRSLGSAAADLEIALRLDAASPT